MATDNEIDGIVETFDDREQRVSEPAGAAVSLDSAVGEATFMDQDHDGFDLLTPKLSIKALTVSTSSTNVSPATPEGVTI